VRYSDTAAMLAPFVQYSDTTGLFSQVVRTFGTQTVGGNKTFSNDIVVNSARVGIGAGGNTSNSVLGYNVFTANTSGTKNTAMGENALSSNVSATDNTAFGWYSLDGTSGSGNTGIGSGALGTNTSGSNNTAIGFGAGEYITGLNPNTTGTNSIYIGFNTKAAANGETNQTVIGHNATGNGSNTVTIGNSSVTGNYFNGFLKQTSVTSALIKASATGQFEAAVAGTDYVAPSALSGYLPLSGGTLTGALSGTSLSMSGAGSFGGNVQAKAAEPYFLAKGTTNNALRGLRIYGQSDGETEFAFSMANFTTGEFRHSAGFATYGGFHTWYVNGAEGMRFNNGNRLLINTTTDNGTDALQVAGSGLFTGTVNLASAATQNKLRWLGYNGAYGQLQSDVGFDATFNGTYLVNNTNSAGNAQGNTAVSSWILSLGAGDAFKLQRSPAGSYSFSELMTVSTTGAATFSSSVYGQGYRFAYAAKSSNYTLTDNDDYINVTSSCTITLPTAVGRSGKRYVIKCVGSVTATIASTSSQTIDGNAANTYTFGGPNFNIMIVYSDGANWFTEAWASGI
jgi:hypothetical protein